MMGWFIVQDIGSRSFLAEAAGRNSRTLGLGDRWAGWALKLPSRMGFNARHDLLLRRLLPLLFLGSLSSFSR